MQVTVVYGLLTVETRKSLWADLLSMDNSMQGEWCVLGDFNALLDYNDRFQGRPVTTYEIQDFAACIENSDLSELRSCGHYYSWTNKSQGDNRILSRIDRCVINSHWLNKYSGAIVDYQNSRLSDHNPLMIDCSTSHSSGGRPFKFFNFMASHEQFDQIINECWNTFENRQWMKQIWQKLKAMKADSSLQSQEQECIQMLKKFLDVKESAYKQKSRIQWLQLGDGNNHYFFQAMKERYARNNIDILYDDQGHKLTLNSSIQAEVLNFYKRLLGSAASTLPGVDIPTVRAGKQVSMEASHDLIAPVTTLEIDHALNCIDDAKAPVIYKIIAKIITLRLQKVMGDVVDLAQAGFIPNRSIYDNTLLATELIKGYTMKHVIPRYMVKIDLKKAYDSVEWPFLQVMLLEIGFPQQFINWIMMCVTSVNYTILINGVPSPPFSAKKGLAANLDKSNVYFAGIQEDETNTLQELFQMPLGSFPFRYLGVPLHSSKLFYTECKPLIAKVVARVKTWTTRKLSYAGRTQLIRSALQGIQAYWCLIFLLPKKVLREIQTTLRSFLWTGMDTTSSKSLISWDYMCNKKVCRGLNFKEIITWNKAAIAKHFWALALKQDRLWIKWLNVYYIKQAYIWTVAIPNRLSWAIKKILEASRHIWSRCLQLINVPVVTDLAIIISTVAKYSRKKCRTHQLLNMMFIESVYHIWIQRNRKGSVQEKLYRAGLEGLLSKSFLEGGGKLAFDACSF
ncbi:uncharacterized protein LOC104905150 [Beta vulgaris subsp. vulgaris]|uniref:uncharacterized protein LOC104905150 n=1 Tax=Beta vulgaris subsp. vulgaris TaxID=3555 RepID=UPI00053FE67C|nr:uncharacterized protein LOC104905150 [Beta vulgaris subsp. vulgaris]